MPQVYRGILRISGSEPSLEMFRREFGMLGSVAVQTERDEVRQIVRAASSARNDVMHVNARCSAFLTRMVVPLLHLLADQSPAGDWLLARSRSARGATILDCLRQTRRTEPTLTSECGKDRAASFARREEYSAERTISHIGSIPHQDAVNNKEESQLDGAFQSQMYGR